MEPENDRSLGKGVLFQYAAASVFMVAGTSFFIFLTKTVSTTEVGNVSLLLAIVQLFSVACSLGLKSGMEHYLSYYIGKGDALTVRKLLIKYGVFTILLSVFSFVVPFLLAPYISTVFYHSSDYTDLIRFVSVDIALAMAFNVLNGMTTGLQKFNASGKIYMVTSIFVYGLAVSFLILTQSIYMMILGWILGYSFGISIYAVFLKGQGATLERGGINLGVPDMLRYSLPILVSTLLLFGSLYIDRLIVAVFLNLSSLGIYNLSVQVAQGVAFFINPLNSILLPKFSEMFSKNDTEGIRSGVRFASNILTLMYTPVALGIAAISPSVLILLGNRNYLPGTIPLIILLVMSSLCITQYVMVQALTGIRRTEAFLMATGLSFLGNLIASFFLIPRFGLIGAGVANSIAPVISFSIIFSFSHRAKVESYDIGSVGRIWISSIIMALVVGFVNYVLGYSPLAILICIVTGVGVFVFLIRLLKGLRKEDAIYFLSLMPMNGRIIERLVKILSA